MYIFYNNAYSYNLGVSVIKINCNQVEEGIGWQGFQVCRSLKGLWECSWTKVYEPSTSKARTGLHVDMSFHFSWVSKGGMIGSCNRYIFNFFQKCSIFPRVVVPFFLPTICVYECQFLHISATTSYGQHLKKYFGVLIGMWSYLIILICIFS